jgi:hypothetical protein
VEALNRGAVLAGCLHNTGEGRLAHAHRVGGELVFQIGTGERAGIPGAGDPARTHQDARGPGETASEAG